MRRLAKTVQWKVYLWSPLGRINRGVLSLYEPPFFALLVNCFSDVGISYLVTCIPLDAPVRSENSQTRPPWIRPVRKSAAVLFPVVCRSWVPSVIRGEPSISNLGTTCIDMHE